MPLRDVIYLVAKPFVGKKTGATKAEVVSRAVEHEELKSAAAELTQKSDAELEQEFQMRDRRAAVPTPAAAVSDAGRPDAGGPGA